MAAYERVLLHADRPATRHLQITPRNRKENKFSSPPICKQSYFKMVATANFLPCFVNRSNRLLAFVIFIHCYSR